MNSLGFELSTIFYGAFMRCHNEIFPILVKMGLGRAWSEIYGRDSCALDTSANSKIRNTILSCQPLDPHQIA